MSWIALLLLSFVATHLAVTLVLGARVVVSSRPVASTLAWLLVIAGAPVLGATLYILIGEPRLGHEREARAAGLAQRLPVLDGAVDDAGAHPRDPPTRMQGCSQLVSNRIGMPPLRGNSLQMLDGALAILERVVADVDAATRSLHMAFYLCQSGGIAGDVLAAVERAAGRGVSCRVLLDAVGSADFLASSRVAALRAAGVQVQAALEVTLLSPLSVRADLRFHRKIILIDGRIGYTGSANLVDPRLFKQDAGVGEWVDAMVRIEGPAVQALGLVAASDWCVETGEPLDGLASDGLLDVQPSPGQVLVQVVPSGPGSTAGLIQEVLLEAFHAARRELVLTTPYLMPGEPMLAALESAAHRGVAVVVLVPERVDSWMARHASRAHFDTLLRAGVELRRYRDGLLHTKAILVDGEMAIFGSVNLDLRSLWLNLELSLIVWDEEFVGQLQQLVQGYVERSTRLDPGEWLARSLRSRLLDGLLRLTSPLL